MKASTLWLSAFLMDQHSHPYMATEKTIHHSTHLCWHCDVSASKCSVQFCQNFPSKKQASLNFVVIIVHSDYGTQEKKIYHSSHLFSIICYEMKGLDGMMLVFWMREWQSTPVFLPGELGGQRSLVGYSWWGHIEWCTTEWWTRSGHWHPDKELSESLFGHHNLSLIKIFLC